MPVDLEEFIRGIAILADNHNMRATLKQSGKGAAVCGAMCFIGGLIAGPTGLAIGGTLGGITAYKLSDSERILLERKYQFIVILKNSITKYFMFIHYRFPIGW